MATNVTFDVLALDKASQTLERVADKVERLVGRLERLDREDVDIDVDVDRGLRNVNNFADTSVSVMAGAFRIVSANAIVMGAAVAAAIAALPAVAALAATGIVLGLGGALAGIATLAAAQSKKVRNEFSDLADHVVKVTKRIAEPFEDTLITVAHVAERTFDAFVPALEKSFKLMAPVLDRFTRDFGKAFEQLEPAIVPMTKAFDAIMGRLGPMLVPLFSDISDALIDLAKVVRRNADDFTDFIGVLLQGIPLAIEAVAKLAELFVDIKDKIISALQDPQSELSRLIDALTEIGTNALPLVVSAAETFAGAFGTVSKIALELVEAFSRLPDGVQQFALALGGAALVAPRILGAISSIGTSIGGFAGTMRNAETRTRAFMGGLRNLAGTGGLLLLAHSATQSQGAMQALEMAAGGALAGMAAGPWGAAIGGVAGLLAALSNNAKHAGKQLTTLQEKVVALQEQLSQNQTSFAGTINKQTGAWTKQSKALARVKLDQAGVLDITKLLGLKTKDLVSGTLGSVKSFRALNRQIDGFVKSGRLTQEEAGAIKSALFQVSESARRGRQDFLRLSGGMQKGVGTAEKLKGKLSELGRTKVEPKVDMGPAESSARSGASRIMGTFNGLQGQANSAGQGVGQSLGQGIWSGISSMVGAVASMAANIVNNAEIAARNAADSKSPSKVWMRIGVDLVKGLREGLIDRTERSKLMSDIDQMVQAASDRLQSKLDRLQAALEARKSIVQSVTGGFTSSIFGADIGGTQVRRMSDIFRVATRERAQARRVNRSIREVIDKGLSKALVRQLLAQGEAGQAQLFALADDASRKELRRLNRLNAQRMKALRRAGMFAGNELVGGRIDRRRAAVEAARDRQANKRAVKEGIREAFHGDGVKVFLVEGKQGRAHLLIRGG